MTSALLLAGGCDAVLGLDEFRDEQAGGGSAAGGAGGAGGASGPCSASGQCIEAPPPGWVGPIALSDPTAARTTCSERYAELVVEGISDINAAPAECSCACEPPSGVSCPAPRLYMSNTSSCPKSGNGSILTGNCQNAFSPPPTNTMTVLVDPGTPTGGRCKAGAEINVPSLSFQTHIACSAAPLQATGCAAGQLCAPLPDDDLMPRYCVYTPGDAPCPSEQGYGEKFLLYEGELIDTRDCSDCTCGAPEGGACTGSSQVYSFGNCSLSKLTVPHDDQCYTLPSPGVPAIRMNSMDTEPGSCMPMGGQPQGEATAADPHTICCTPEIN